MKLLWLYLISFFTLFISAKSEAQVTNVGRSPYAIEHKAFDCSGFKASLRGVKVVNLAFLWHTFGDNTKCLAEVMKDPRLAKLEAHLINGPCQSNSRCGTYEFLHGLSRSQTEHYLKTKNPGFIRKLRKYAQGYSKFLKAHLAPQTQCYVSGILEHHLSKAATLVINDILHEEFPDCKIVNNPASDFGMGLAHADVLEGHGPTPQIYGDVPCIVNLDGNDINFPKRHADESKGAISVSQTHDYIDNYSYCESTYLWVGEDNCNAVSNGRFVDPRARACNTHGTNNLIREILLWAQKDAAQLAPPKENWTSNEEKSFVGCRVFKDVHDGDKRNFLLKQSDSYPGGVIILPVSESKIKKVEIVHNGKVVDTYKRTGSYTEDGGSRPLWRSNKKISLLPYHSVIREDNGAICRKVINPKIRND